MKQSRRQFWGVEPMRRSIVRFLVPDRHSLYQQQGRLAWAVAAFALWCCGRCSASSRCGLSVGCGGGWWAGWPSWGVLLRLAVLSHCASSRWCVSASLVGWWAGWGGGVSWRRRLVAAASRGGGVSRRRRLAAAASRGGVSRVLLSAASVFVSLIVPVAHSAAVSVVGSSDWRCPFARVQLV